MSTPPAGTLIHVHRHIRIQLSQDEGEKDGGAAGVGGGGEQEGYPSKGYDIHVCAYIYTILHYTRIMTLGACKII